MADLPDENGTASALKAAIKACRHCQDEGLLPEARPIFQWPDRPTIGLFSQAPGNLAHQGGRPFMDPSGVRLRQWLDMDEPTFYESGALAILPMAFCFPGYDGTGPTGRGGDLPPPKACAALWREQVMVEVMPSLRLILLVGGYSQQWHLGKRRQKTLTATVADWRERFAEAGRGEGPLILPLPHPSWRNTGWLKKNPWFQDEVLPRMQAEIKAALAFHRANA